ncbi:MULTISPECIES: hypothetical protein [Sphingobacterium]|jgi:hypothetical protein|uniref:hypothetical protein n=1 Tax=Sphingobacterium TaxID=28453 RepID=UPI000C0BDABB|nr:MULTISPECIES: hypothetical protein [Sphingobacterium]MCT1531706.1 hypothetical protein [Sphingobacterium daejeonense]
MENLMNEKKFTEGGTTKAIENVTGQVPSKVYLCAAVAAMASSAVLKCMGHKHTALFIGQWVAPFLLFGVYNKIVKTEGHD